ncbi:MAG TPA: S8 family serine peptidase [Candidatus Moranbacteria bacterium]|nr:S8 family serine peptidase [Candidatus Moranbacteria bacterium]
MKKLNRFFIKHFLLFVGVFVFAGGCMANEKEEVSVAQNQNYPPREIVIQFKKELLSLEGEDNLQKAQEKISQFNGKLLHKNEISNVAIFQLDQATFEKKSIKEAQKFLDEEIAELKKLPSVKFAEPNYQRRPLSIKTNDPLRNKLWGLDNKGQEILGFAGTVDADIDAPEAWVISSGLVDIPVAIIDTGINYNHPDLVSNLWNGSDCLDKNGVYLGGCLHGYDFEKDDPDPMMEDNEHGTLVAGIIGATPNNNIGILGVAPRAKIMSLKSSLTIYELVNAIDFIIANDVKIINASYGGEEFSQIEYQAIKKFGDHGGILVAGAGNNNTNNDSSHHYPSDYNLNNIISVAATNQSDQLSSFSNYGKISVDVAAPGENILTTSGQNNSFVYISGTSMAAPYVSGLTALLWSYKPNLSAQQVRQLILESGDSLPTLANKTSTGKRINAYKTLDNPFAQTKELYRFYSQNHQAHFYTISKAERDHIIATYPREEWNYEGIAWKGFENKVSGLKLLPVYRFYSLAYRKHFFTISEAEKNKIFSGAYPEAQWNYEGVAWYAYPTINTGLSPIYRFYNQNHQAHFYTISKTERDHIITTYPREEWNYEGIAYYSLK